MIIDAHQHFWDLSRAEYGWLTPDGGVLYRNYLPQDLAETLRVNGVVATVLVQAAAAEAETHYLLQLAAEYPFVAGVVGWVDFESSDAPGRIESLAAAGGGKLKGLRPMIQDIADCAWLTNGALDAAFESMIAHDLVFDALVKPKHLNVLRERLIRHPQLDAVLDHAGKPDIARGDIDTWARDVQRLARETSITCKLSGLLTEAGDRNSADELAPFVAHIFSCFGPERVIWGSDWPVLNRVSDYAQWLEVSRNLVKRFAPGHTADVLAHSARRLYRLELN